MWLVTGDIHGIGSNDCLKIMPDILKKDYNLSEIEGIIICGDFGGVWVGKGKSGSAAEQKKLDEMNSWGYSIYFLDGNHENYPAIMKYPVIERFGGKMHEIRPNIHHLMRGEIYTINEKRIFVLGGATSIDKRWRIEGVSWWPDEVPSTYDVTNAKNNLDKVGWKVDYVLTHCVPSDWLSKLFTFKQTDKVTDLMQDICNKIEYEHWYAGHYHLDMELKEEKATVMYDYICELGKTTERVPKDTILELADENSMEDLQNRLKDMEDRRG